MLTLRRGWERIALRQALLDTLAAMLCAPAPTYQLNCSVIRVTPRKLVTSSSMSVTTCWQHQASETDRHAEAQTLRQPEHPIITSLRRLDCGGRGFQTGNVVLGMWGRGVGKAGDV
eukprot:2416402-Rhodomonas_salina.1